MNDCKERVSSRHNWTDAGMNSQTLWLQAQSLNQVNLKKIPKVGEGNEHRLSPSTKNSPIDTRKEIVFSNGDSQGMLSTINHGRHTWQLIANKNWTRCYFAHIFFLISTCLISFVSLILPIYYGYRVVVLKDSMCVCVLV